MNLENFKKYLQVYIVFRRYTLKTYISLRNPLSMGSDTGLMERTGFTALSGCSWWGALWVFWLFSSRMPTCKLVPSLQFPDFFLHICIQFLGWWPWHQHHWEGEAEWAGLPRRHRVPRVCLWQAGNKDHPQHVSWVRELVSCKLIRTFRIKFDDSVKEMLPETLLDMKRALYEVQQFWVCLMKSFVTMIYRCLRQGMKRS